MPCGRVRCFWGQVRKGNAALLIERLLLGDLSLWVRSPTHLRFPCSGQVKAHRGGTHMQPMGLPSPGAAHGSAWAFLYFWPKANGSLPLHLPNFPSEAVNIIEKRPTSGFLTRRIHEHIKTAVSHHYMWHSLLGNSSNWCLWPSVLTPDVACHIVLSFHM